MLLFPTYLPAQQIMLLLTLYEPILLHQSLLS